MGLHTFLQWLWGPPKRLSSAPHPHISHPSKTHPSQHPAKHLSHRQSITLYEKPKRLGITFSLPSHIYAWLEATAVRHNYGSVHKSVRDLLAWASIGCHEDLQWLFGTDHHVPACLDVRAECGTEASVIAGSQGERGGEVVVLEARLSKPLGSWVNECVEQFGLDGPSTVLDTLCRCAITQCAEDDIFGSDESGQALPTSSAELYHDLGIRAPYWR